MAQGTICLDLLRSIIEYIPRNDLREFSNASPIICREIFATGIRLVYYKTKNEMKILNLIKGDYIIIRLNNSGIKDILVRRNDHYLSLVNLTTKYNKTVKIKDRVNFGLTYKYCRYTKKLFHYINGVYTIIPCDDIEKYELVGLRIDRMSRKSSFKIAEKVNWAGESLNYTGIDFNNGYVQNYLHNHFEYEPFEIIWNDHKWK